MRLFATSSLLSLALLAGAGAMAQDAESLYGEWRVVELNGAPLLPGSAVTINFSSDGRLSGRASCNRYGAGYRVEGGWLSISQAFATQMACAPQLMRQERRFLSILNGKVGWTIANDRLTLTASDHSKLRAARVG